MPKDQVTKALKEITFNETFFSKEFREYGCFFIKVTIPGYAEYLGWELVTIYTGIYGDKDIISSWVAFQSVSA